MAGGYGRYPSCRIPRYGYTAPRNYRHGGEMHMQSGYSRRNGAYVLPHLKTRPDNSRWNNLSNWR